MTGNETSHITVTYKDGDAEITCSYAISEDTLRDANVWSSQQTNPPGKDLQSWLKKRECQLDSCNGPAYVRRFADGGVIETYCHHGRWHRDGGPAYIRRYPDGSTEEEYYRNGRRHRDDGPAVIHHHADGYTEERYCQQGKLHREDGPAVVRRGADGSMSEEYYHDGNYIGSRDLAPPSVISGVTIRPPAPKAPTGPVAPGPA
jgi:hypothetical protein